MLPASFFIFLPLAIHKIILRNCRKKPRKSATTIHKEKYHTKQNAFKRLYFASQVVLIIEDYEERILDNGFRIIYNHNAPYCPDCGELLSGYDRRKRSVLDDTGAASIYLLRRLYCQKCRRLHLEVPNIIFPQKHYKAALIRNTVAGDVDYCPADDSTIRRWKKVLK